jgi:hypothetical protein
MAKRNDRSLLNYLGSSKTQLIPIVLLIAIICLALGLGLAFADLDSPQRWLLIACLIIFPIVSLVFCTWLILRNSRGLYVSRNDSEMLWELMLPEAQRRKLNAEIVGIASILKIPKEQLSDLRSAYIVAEDLALRQIEQELERPIVRHVTIEGAEFDGILVNRDLVTFIDSFFLVAPEISQEKIKSLLKKVEFAGKKVADLRNGTKSRLMLAVVTQLDAESEAKLRSSLVDKFTSTPVDVDIRLLDFEGLQRIFSAD